MRTLIYGAGPIGRWLAHRLHQAGTDVTLLGRNQTFRSLEQKGIEIVDGLTGERLATRVRVVDRLEPEDRYDLVVVAMQKAGRRALQLAVDVSAPDSVRAAVARCESELGPIDVHAPPTEDDPNSRGSHRLVALVDAGGSILKMYYSQEHYEAGYWSQLQYP